MRNLTSRLKPIKVTISRRLGSRKYRPLLINSGIGLWEWHIPRNRVKITDSWLSMARFSAPVEVALANLKHQIHKDDFHLFTKSFKELLAGKKRFVQSDFRMKGNADNWIWIHSVSYVSRTDRHHLPVRIFGITQNISWRKEMEHEILLKTKQLKDSEKYETIGKIAGGIAHDFNNSLMGILGFAELIHKESHSDEITLYASQIEKAAKDSSRLTHNLLSFARKGNYLFQKLDLCSLVSDVLNDYRETKPESIAIETLLCKSPKEIDADPEQLKKCLGHILINAQEAMNDRGSITVATSNEEEIRIRVDVGRGKATFRTLAKGHYYKITISDTGPGIADADLNRIFDPFFTTGDEHIHSGMGLSAVYGTIKAHGGYVAADNNLKQGARIEIYLPASD